MTVKLLQYINLFAPQFRSPHHDSLTILTSQAITAPELSRIVSQMLYSLLFFSVQDQDQDSTIKLNDKKLCYISKMPTTFGVVPQSFCRIKILITIKIMILLWVENCILYL